MNREGLYQWGPDLPDDFVDARMIPGRLWRVLRMAINDKAHLRRMMALKESLSKPGRHWRSSDKCEPTNDEPPIPHRSGT